MPSASAEVGVMIATLIAVIVANACFSIMIPSLIATSVLEIAYHSKQWTDYVEGYCFTSRDFSCSWCGSAANKSGAFSMASPLERCDSEISLMNHGIWGVRH